MNNKKRIIIILCLFAAVTAVVIAKHLSYNAAYSDLETNISSDANAVSQQQLPTFLELGSHSCIPCKQMMPILKELKDSYSAKLNVLFIDVWKDQQKAKDYNISVIPTQIFLDPKGGELYRHEGFFPKEDILAKWKELGYNF